MLSALPGPIGDIMIADYLLYRKKQPNVPALYSLTGEYRYAGGFSLVALAALPAGALPSLPRFLASNKVVEGAQLAPFLLNLYNYAWFVGFGVVFGLYLALRSLAPNR